MTRNPASLPIADAASGARRLTHNLSGNLKSDRPALTPRVHKGENGNNFEMRPFRFPGPGGVGCGRDIEAVK